MIGILFVLLHTKNMQIVCKRYSITFHNKHLFSFWPPLVLIFFLLCPTFVHVCFCRNELMLNFMIGVNCKYRNCFQILFSFVLFIEKNAPNYIFSSDSDNYLVKII